MAIDKPNINEEKIIILYLAYSLSIQMSFPDIYIYLSMQKGVIEFDELRKAIEHYKGNEWGEDLVELIKWMRRFTINIDEDYVRKVGVFFSKLFEVLKIDTTSFKDSDNLILLRIFQIQSTVMLNQKTLTDEQISNIDNQVQISRSEIFSAVENEDSEVEDGYEYINLGEERAREKSTWNKSKVSAIRYNDGVMRFSEQVNSFAHALAVFLEHFHSDNPKRFESMVNQYKVSELRVLFTGSSREGEFESMKLISGSDIRFETKTNSYYKVFNMLRILEILEKKPEKLELLVKLHNE